MKVLFTIWAKVGTKKVVGPRLYIGIFAPKKLDEKIIQII